MQPVGVARRVTVAVVSVVLLAGCGSNGASPGASSASTGPSASPTSTVPSPTGSPDVAVRAGLAALRDRLPEGWTASGGYDLGGSDSTVTFQVRMSSDVRAARMTYRNAVFYVYGDATRVWVNALGRTGWRDLAPDLSDAQRSALGDHWTLVPAGELAHTLGSLDGLLAQFADIGTNARWTDTVDVLGTPCWTVTTDAGEIHLPVGDPYLRTADLGTRTLDVTMGAGVPVDPLTPGDDVVPWPG